MENNEPIQVFTHDEIIQILRNKQPGRKKKGKEFRKFFVREFLNQGDSGELAALLGEIDSSEIKLSIRDCHNTVTLHQWLPFDESPRNSKRYQNQVTSVQNAIYKFGALAVAANAMRNHLLLEILRCRPDAGKFFKTKSIEKVLHFKTLQDAEFYLVSNQFEIIDQKRMYLPESIHSIFCFSKGTKYKVAVILRNPAVEIAPIMVLVTKIGEGFKI